ncbi:DNA invertase Pin-like site-specific DNA recombinase [Georgenia soli]|uniref:DNA invertase Pin-like site-specific DNA recombinase n=1 Tax=Georgenia soli TaxID=638953 RepID=A0A2A9F165_9MICO|nr:recombinase family protein [Georgenia soli]PFG44898.1 DNA invertase Pin-like site-specific DNA recombinase [Georgenia soli]
MTQHTGQRIGYARVSSTDQNLARQVATLGQVHRLFEEKQSGARRDGRTALADLIGYAREGDTVVVSSMDRLARSVVDLNQIVGELVAKGVVVEFLSERVTFRPGATDAFADFQLNIMASFAQLERAIAKERQAEGIRAAKARGVYTGRARKLTAQDLANAREWIGAGVPKAQVARRLGIDRSTLYRALPLTTMQTSSDAGPANGET